MRRMAVCGGRLRLNSCASCARCWYVEGAILRCKLGFSKLVCWSSLHARSGPTLILGHRAKVVIYQRLWLNGSSVRRRGME
jgi:hypothetical protein